MSSSSANASIIASSVPSSSPEALIVVAGSVPSSSAEASIVVAGSVPSSSAEALIAVSECDIGKLLYLAKDLQRLGKEDKYQILKQEPNPHPSAYPHTSQSNSDPFRHFLPSWLVQYPWLHYSPFCDGAFCRACTFVCTTKSWWSGPRPICHKAIQIMGQSVT